PTMNETIRPSAMESRLVSASSLIAWACPACEPSAFSSCSWPACSGSAGITATAAPALAAFSGGDGGDHERCGRVCPPPAGERVQQQTDQQRDGEIRAELVLCCLLDGC